MARKAGWKGQITIKDLNTGEVRTVQNAILDAGLQLTAQLWLGEVTETFQDLQIEQSDGTVIATKAATTSWTLNTGEVVVTSEASFTSGEVTADVATVALLGSGGTRIAEASITVSSGSAVQITREDSLSEV